MPTRDPEKLRAKKRRQKARQRERKRLGIVWVPPPSMAAHWRAVRADYEKNRPPEPFATEESFAGFQKSLRKSAEEEAENDAEQERETA